MLGHASRGRVNGKAAAASSSGSLVMMMAQGVVGVLCHEN